MPLKTLKFGDVLLQQQYSAKGLVINGTASLEAVLVGSVSVNPPSIAGGGAETVSVTITGVKTGDFIFLTAPSTLETGLVFVGASVSANNTVDIKIANFTAGAIDGADRSWGYLVLRTS